MRSPADPVVFDRSAPLNSDHADSDHPEQRSDRHAPRHREGTALPPAPGGGRMSAGVPATGVVDARPAKDIGTLRALWRFRSYGQVELRALLLGVLMRGCE